MEIKGLENLSPQQLSQEVMRGDVSLETALGNQKSFWRFVGILTLVIISLYALIIVFAIFGAMAMFSR